MSQAGIPELETVVVAISKQQHSGYALNWFLQHLMRERFHVILTHVVPSPMEAEYFTTLGSFSVPSIVYTAENLEAAKSKVNPFECIVIVIIDIDD